MLFDFKTNLNGLLIYVAAVRTAIQYLGVLNPDGRVPLCRPMMWVTFIGLRRRTEDTWQPIIKQMRVKKGGAY